MVEKEYRFSGKVKEDAAAMERLFEDCADIKKKEMTIGSEKGITCFLMYIEITMSSVMLRTTALGNFLARLSLMPEEEIYRLLQENGMGLSDVMLYETAEEAGAGLLTGDAILLVDGFPLAMKIPDKGYPGETVQDTDSEKVLRGTNEGFNENVKINTALMRKRLQSTDLKVEEMVLGVRTKTLVNVVYMKGIVKQELVDQVKMRLSDFLIDGILDSGMAEQLTEETWISPFPQIQTTLRPDRAVMEVLDGKVVVLCNNTPSALVMPADYNSFVQTTDDYYQRPWIASFGRMLRYIATFFAVSLPGLYLAVTNFQTGILPTTLLLSFAAARQGVPFPAVVEVILMELSFELLREAGVRLPGAMGNTIGIVGGLIIGQAAVDANIVSPIVVIVVAFTALCSFSIPNEEFASAFRLLKFFVILMSAWLGFFGFLWSMVAILTHLALLKSFGHPYLIPYVGIKGDGEERRKDSIVRFPLEKLIYRSIHAKTGQKRRFRKKENDKND
ncbi:MAG: spore germination protein [Lachnospiraceae bacterium]|nr:spore germination protein [Lachnospiraceae bacterium]